MIKSEVEVDQYRRKNYHQMLQNIEVHFGKFKNSYNSIDFDRKYVLGRGQKLLFSQREYIGRKGTELLLEDVGFDIDYFSYDLDIEMGVFVCKVRINN